MTFHAFAGGESGGGQIHSGVYSAVSGLGDATIVAAPGGFPGTKAFSISPVDGNPNDQYGWTAGLSQQPIILVSFMYRFVGVFDASITIAELGDILPAGAYARRITQNTDEALILADEADAIIFQTANGIIAANTDYHFLWYVDLRTEASSRDMLWMWQAGDADWDAVFDVSNHGFGNSLDIDQITFGTCVGKGLPTTGGPFYVKEMCAQCLDAAPNMTPIGSVATRFKVPTANGTDGDFDTGTGANPDWNDVKEIPSDGDASYDEGDQEGDQQGYEIAAAEVGEDPLAVQVIGAGQRSGGAGSDIKPYLYDGATREYATQYNIGVAGYRTLNASWEHTTFNEFDGAAISEAVFNGLEAGVEVVNLAGGSVFRLTQIGLEYMVEGPRALPDDFPVGEPPEKEVDPAGGPILGSADPMMV